MRLMTHSGSYGAGDAHCSHPVVGNDCPTARLSEAGTGWCWRGSHPEGGWSGAERADKAHEVAKEGDGAGDEGNEDDVG